MADLLTQGFPGSALPTGWTTDHATGGSSSVSGGQLTVSNTTTVGSRGRVRSPSLATWVNGDTLTVKTSSAASFVSIIVLRMDTSTSAIQPSLVASGSNWIVQVFRDSTGYGAPTGTITPRDRAAYPWLRFRRVTSTSVIGEAADDVSGSPGSWVGIGTIDSGVDPVTFNWATTQLEILTTDPGGGGSAGATVIATVGSGAVTPPTISAFTPAFGPVGTTVTLTVNTTAPVTSVSFNGTAASTFTRVDGTTVTAVVPTGATTGAITIVAANGTGTSSTNFTVRLPALYTAPPTLNNPNTSYIIGTTLAPITLQAVDQYGLAWTGGGLPDATVSSLSLPVSVTGTLTKSPNQGTGVWTFSDLVPTIIVTAPSTVTITSFNPMTGAVGTVVTITGTGFTGATAVTIGALPCAFTVTNATTILATIPAGAS